jgi:hypothetical protein
LRERVKEFERRGAQHLTVLAEEPFFIRHLPGGEVPYPVLADPAATVSATYGVAFQAKRWNGWVDRPATFMIDRQGVIRYAGDSPEADLLQIILDLEEERVLIEALKAKKAPLRRAATWALAPIGPDTEAAIPVLLEALKEEDATVRSGAAAALGWIAPRAEAAVPLLIETLADKDGRVRRLAAAALGRIGPHARAAVPVLLGARKDKEVRVRKVATSALKKIDPGAAVRAGAR